MPSEPKRYLDTRDGGRGETFDGAFAGGGRIPAGGSIEVDVAGRGDVPADAAAVVMISPAAVTSRDRVPGPS